MSKNRSKFKDVHGLLFLNKPQGISSNKALQKVRHLMNAKKAGHTGSLDPMATGLLPCCFGDATKVAGLMLNADKVYIAECLIGAKTDTADATGTVIETSEKKQVTDSEIQQATSQLTGEISQIPPMYSALHHKGKRLYDFARAGIEVERKARPITIHYFKTLSVNTTDQEQRIKFEIKVSKGTYIRTLLEDFAAICGTCAHMTSLHRTQLGILKNNMVSFEELQSTKPPVKFLKPMDRALLDYNKIQVDDKNKQTLIHGLTFKTDLEIGIYRIYDQNDVFMGLGESQFNGQFRVKKLFLKSYDSRYES